MPGPLDRLLSPQLLLLPALLLLLAPWCVGLAATSAAAISAFAIGLVLLLLCWAAATERPHWAVRGALPAGAWALVAAVLFGSEASGEPSWVHLAAGLLTLVICTWNLEQVRPAGPSRATPSKGAGENGLVSLS